MACQHQWFDLARSAGNHPAHDNEGLACVHCGWKFPDGPTGEIPIVPQKVLYDAEHAQRREGLDTLLERFDN